MTTPLPEPKGQRLAYRCVAGDGEDEYEDFYTEAQLREYGAAEYKRAILDAMNATGAFGKTGEVIAMVIRQLGATP